MDKALVRASGICGREQEVRTERSDINGGGIEPARQRCAEPFDLTQLRPGSAGALHPGLEEGLAELLLAVDGGRPAECLSR